MGGDVDQRGLEPFGVGIAELERGQFLQVVVQQPGMIERGLQDQRLAQRHRGAGAAMQRARRHLLADHDIRRVAGTDLGTFGAETRRAAAIAAAFGAGRASSLRPRRAAGNCRARLCAGAKNCRSRSWKSCR